MAKRSPVEYKEKRKFGRLDIILAGVMIILIALAVYLTRFNIDKCESFACFKDKMEKCEKTEYINEVPEASWRYKITEDKNDECIVKVTLLLAKEGELGIDKLTGYDMLCTYPKGEGTYPERDLRMCHGRLKEELQQIIINKLHSYIIENLGQIDLGINSI